MRTDPIAEAVTFAEEAHRGQTRKGTDAPYLAHLLGVASIVLEHGGDQDQAVAAVLHDTVEDTDVTLDAVRARFGERVAVIVDACTDTLEDSDRDRDGTAEEWLERKRVGTIWYYGALVEALGARLEGLADPRQRQLGDELRAVVARLAQVSGLGEIPREVSTRDIIEDAGAVVG